MFKELLASEFAPWGTLSEKQLDQLEAHYRQLIAWNPRLNLTRITELREAVQFHYCESLFLAASLPASPLRIVDIGSGAGFPGVPVAVFRPDCEITLVESHQRKSVFLREVSRHLTNVRVVAKRGQDISDRFDIMISRAVTPAEVLDLRLADHLSLLIGLTDASMLKGTPVALPWGNSRVLFHVKRESPPHS